MADTIHKVGEGMHVLMCVFMFDTTCLFFYLHVWCALRPLTLGYTATLPRGSPLRIAGGSTSSAGPGGGGNAGAYGVIARVRMHIGAVSN